MYAVPYLQLKRHLCPKQKQFLQPRWQRAAVRTPVMIQTLRRRRSQQRLAFLSSLFNVRLTVMNNSKFDEQNCVWNWARLSWAIKCSGCCRYNAKRHFHSAIGTGPCKNKFLVQHPLCFISTSRPCFYPKTARAYFLCKDRFTYSCYCKFDLYICVCWCKKMIFSFVFLAAVMVSKWRGGRMMSGEEEW